MKDKFTITGITCSACSQAVDRAVNKLDGVTEVSVNLLTNSMQVSFDNNIINSEQIIQAVQDAGYDAIPDSQALSSPNQNTEININPLEAQLAQEQQSLKKRFFVSLIFLVPLMYIAMAPMLGLPALTIFEGPENSIVFAFSQMLLTLPVMIINHKYFANGFKTLIKRRPNMDSLIALGSSAAFIYGIFVIYRLAYALGHNQPAVIQHYAHSLYFESAAMILTLITLGKFLEAKSKGKTTDAIRKLMDLSPKTAIRLEDDKEIEIPIEQVKVGDILIVKPGSSVPVDGRIISGQGSFDQSAITGESMPVEKGPDQEIIGSTILKLGSITMRAEKVGNDTTIAKIIQLVQDANATKAPIAQLADKVAGVFVPVVIGIATLATVIWLLSGQSFEFALTIGISVLIISCPCALGLATPVAIMVGTGKGASNGILIKSAEALETLHEIDSIILDKTGTITDGKPVVTDIVLLSDLRQNEFLQIAASLEAPSEHPLSLAILEYAAASGIKILPVDNFFNTLGKGIEATINGKRHIAGNQTFMLENGVDISPTEKIFVELSQAGKTVLYFAEENQLLGIIAVADPIKPNSKQAIEMLHKLGVKIYMLTGDNQRTAEAIGRELGLDQVIAEVLPQEKEKKVRQIKQQGSKVAMVGDGINDAPALARADVGIAIGAGTDIAIEAADIVLMKSDLLDVVNSIELSKRTIHNIKQNLFWAFFYNIILIPVAAGVLYLPFSIVLNPMIASASMSLSSVFVVTNALRLNRFKPLIQVDAREANQTDKSDYSDILVKSINLDNAVKSADSAIQFETAITNIYHINNANDTKKGDSKIMKKIIKIEGMFCPHCSGRVEKVLNQIDGVSATVDLENKQAKVKSNQDIDNQILIDTITDAGYQVVEIIE
ncbi:MAG TPA: heavy metal translocating P-type ATPase [Clostridiaceae bacterium]|nr:heavy metal translocating P-type ATPase [Clostridiaceae bacterium]